MGVTWIAIALSVRALGAGAADAGVEEAGSALRCEGASYLAGDSSMGDFDRYACSRSLVFQIEVPDAPPTESVMLAVNGFDVDEEDGEINHVFLNEHFLGAMSGANGVWSTTSFRVAPEWLRPGVNTIRYEIDALGTGWCSEVNWAQLVWRGGARARASISAAQFDRVHSTGSSQLIGGAVTAEFLSPGEYLIELNTIAPDLSNVYAAQLFVPIGESGVWEQELEVPIDASARSGRYRIELGVYRADDGMQEDFLWSEIYYDPVVGVVLPPEVSLWDESVVVAGETTVLPFTVSTAATARDSIEVRVESSGALSRDEVETTNEGVLGAMMISPRAEALGESLMEITATDGRSSVQLRRCLEVAPSRAVAPTLPSGVELRLSPVALSNTVPFGDPIEALLQQLDGGPVSAVAVSVRSAAEGEWQFRLADDSEWTALVVRDSAEVVPLGPADSLRFVPNGRAAGFFEAEFRAWDESDGERGSPSAPGSLGEPGPFSQNSGAIRVEVLREEAPWAQRELSDRWELRAESGASSTGVSRPRSGGCEQTSGASGPAVLMIGLWTYCLARSRRNQRTASKSRQRQALRERSGS